MRQKRLHPARMAIAAIFFIHGVITGAWVPHIPLAQARLGLDLAHFGVALLALAAGAVAAMPAAGLLINKYGSARLTLITGLCLSLAFVMPALAPEPLSFVVGLLAFGASLGAMDVSMNAHGIAIEKRLRRPFMSLLHGMYSLGAMSGAGLSAFVLERVPAEAHIAGAALIAAAAVAVASRYLLPAGVDRGLSESRFFALPSRATIGLGSLCFLVLMAEGAVLDWSAIQLKEAYGLTAARAGLGYACFAAGMALSRLAGDRLRSRYGSVALVRWSGALTAAGMLAALTSSNSSFSIAAYALAGIGIGNIVPVLFGGGGRLEPNAPGRGIAAVVTMGYTGFVAGPPFIGMVGEVLGISAALGAIVAGGLIIAGAAGLARAADPG